MHPASNPLSHGSRNRFLTLVVAVALAALANAQDLTTALYPDDATRRAACEHAMATGEEAADLYRATIVDQSDRTLYAYVVTVHAPLHLLAIGCENNMRYGWGYTVDELLRNETYASDHVSVIVSHRRLPEAFFMVNNHANLVAVDAAGREIARVEPDPMDSDLIAAGARRTLDAASGLLLWEGYSDFALPLHDETFREAIVNGAELRIEWRAPAILYMERGAWAWPAGFGH